jgi:hypothetical protein
MYCHDFHSRTLIILCQQEHLSNLGELSILMLLNTYCYIELSLFYILFAMPNIRLNGRPEIYEIVVAKSN